MFKNKNLLKIQQHLVDQQQCSRSENIKKYHKIEQSQSCSYQSLVLSYHFNLKSGVHKVTFAKFLDAIYLRFALLNQFSLFNFATNVLICFFHYMTETEWYESKHKPFQNGMARGEWVGKLMSHFEYFCTVQIHWCWCTNLLCWAAKHRVQTPLKSITKFCIKKNNYVALYEILLQW